MVSSAALQAEHQVEGAREGPGWGINAHAVWHHADSAVGMQAGGLAAQMSGLAWQAFIRMQDPLCLIIHASGAYQNRPLGLYP